MRTWSRSRSSCGPMRASYVALAELLDGTVLTLDGRLAKAPGLRCTVQAFVA